MKKAFDTVDWMRHRRAQIDQEDANLTWTQKREKTHELVRQDPILSQLSEKTLAPDKVGHRA